MSLKIRRASVTDLDKILEIEKSCFSVDRQSSKRSIQNSLVSNYQSVWVAELTKDNENIVAGVMVLHQPKMSIRVYSLAVNPKYQGHGIGLSLLKYAEIIAAEKELPRLSLEVDESNSKLVAWYLNQDFQIERHLQDYYAQGKPALRLVKNPILNNSGILSELKIKPVEQQDVVEQYNFETLDDVEVLRNNAYGTRIKNILVLDKVEDWGLDSNLVDVVSAKDYLNHVSFQTLKNVRVFNLCSSYKYQTFGYYVSLIAAARDHRAIPSVSTIQDFKSQSVVRTIAESLDDSILRKLNKINGKSFDLYVYFGQSIDANFSDLARQLYSLFESPLLRVTFLFDEKWIVRKVNPLSLSQIPVEHREYLPGFASNYFKKKRFHSRSVKHYKYDLAILVNEDEKNPPSCERALKKFQKAAEYLNFYVEFIGRDDIGRLSEFDALFIRETTSVNHYTYKFSRAAWAEGLVVIDDPWSILKCANKVYLNEYLKHAKINAPKTWVLHKDSLKNGFKDEVIFPLILKQPDSSFSVGVKKVNNFLELENKLKEMLKTSDLIIAQEFLPSEYDWRVGVLDRKPLFACKYFMAKGHWQIYNWDIKSEYNYGKSLALPIEEVPDFILASALKAANQIGDGFYGVDLKEIDSKAYVIEVNDNPNVEAGYEDRVLGDELYLKIMQSFLNRIHLARM